ncbi:unnamed protein product [Phaeothamnion confervicola]
MQGSRLRHSHKRPHLSRTEQSPSTIPTMAISLGSATRTQRVKSRLLVTLALAILASRRQAAAFLPISAAVGSMTSSAFPPAAITAALRSRTSQPQQQQPNMAADGYIDRVSDYELPSSMPLHDFGSADAPRIPLGTVTLVGAGPGDPELLTVAAYRVLREADLVIADRLVSSEILALVSGELRVANKHPGCQEAAQNEIYEWLEAGVLAGKHVARLKIGDPFVFGRGAEEVLHVRRYGIQAKVVPGITSVFSAPLLAGIPVTHRDVANQVTLGTGYGKDSSRPDIADYRPDATAVFLMAVGRLPALTQDLMRRGYPADCPVAVVENASNPNQRVLVGSVADIARIAAEHKARPPATIVVGEVVRVLQGDVNGVVAGVSAGSAAEAALTAADTTAAVARSWPPPLPPRPVRSAAAVVECVDATVPVAVKQ